jgi:hypothetical protein
MRDQDRRNSVQVKSLEQACSVSAHAANLVIRPAPRGFQDLITRGLPVRHRVRRSPGFQVDNCLVCKRPCAMLAALELPEHCGQGPWLDGKAASSGRRRRQAAAQTERRRQRQVDHHGTQARVVRQQEATTSQLQGNGRMGRGCECQLYGTVNHSHARGLEGSCWHRRD